MTYAQGHVVRLIGGRLALDFLNTADWTDTGDVVHEKIESTQDLKVWLRAVGFPNASHPKKFGDVLSFRRDLRMAFTGAGNLAPAVRDLNRFVRSIRLGQSKSVLAARRQPALSLIAVSALALLLDPRELDRVKLCPGHDCGWLFLDETKNARRKWCMMETCGNRAKAARSYARKTKLEAR